MIYRITATFTNIIGAGLAIPCTLVVIANIVTKSMNGDRYDLDVTKLFKIYLIALLGWALIFGVEVLPQ